MKKKNLVIMIFLIILIIGTLFIRKTFSRYVIERKGTHVQESTAFYFDSNLKEQEYRINEWNGKDSQDIKFNVKNYIDSVQVTDEEIKYDIEAQIIDEDGDNINDEDLVSIEIEDENGNNISKEKQDTNGNKISYAENLVLNSKTENAEQILKENQYKLVVTSKSDKIENGKIINIQLKIKAISPYTKEITSNIKMKVHINSNYVTNIVEAENGEYVKLNIKVNNPEKDLGIKFDNTKLELDKSSYILKDIYILTQTTMDSLTIPKARFEKGNTYEVTFIKKTQGTIEKGTDIITNENQISYTEGTIIFSNPEWNSNKAKVKITNNSTYSLQYKIVGVNDVIDETDMKGWITVNPKTITIENLKYADKIIARLYDGEKYTQYASCIISDAVAPILTAIATETTTKTITIKATSVDNESGLADEKPYKYYIAQSLDGIENASVNGSNTTGIYTFKELDAYLTYYIKVEREDLAGNKGSITIQVRTLMVPSAEENITKEIQWIETETPETAQAKIKLSTDTAYTIKYGMNRENQTNWKEYTGEITLTNGETIYIALSDGRNYGQDYVLKVEDNEGPIVNITKTENKTNSISVSVEARDSISGMPENIKYNYYIKEIEAESYALKAENQVSNTYTFTSLTANKQYSIRVTTKDLIGNIGEGILEIITPRFDLVTGNIEVSNKKWNNKLASIDITNNTEYELQYQVIPEGASIQEENSAWTKATEKTTTVGNLKNNYIVVARLFDGTNYTKYSTTTIQDTTAPTIKVTQTPTEWSKENVTLTINAEDIESGLQNTAYSFDGGTTWQTENTKTYQENTLGIVIKVRDEAGNISTYNTINITNIDKTGPEFEVSTTSTSSSITVNVTNLKDAGVQFEELINYDYYIAKSEKELATAQKETDTTINKYSSKTYTSLTQGITYYIKIEISDKLGNTTSKIITAETGSIATDFTISDVIWENKKASVTITNNSNYNLQYQVVDNETDEPTTDGWITKEATVKEINCGDLLNNYTVYVRLTDGTNNSPMVRKQIKDITEPTVKISGNPEEWTKENVTITITAEDTESGLQDEAYSFDGGTTWQVENTKEYEKNTTGIIIKVRDIAGNTKTETIDITKIDKEGPTVTVQEVEKDINTITVSANATDTGIGIAENVKYKYSYRAEGKIEYTSIETSEKTYKFTGLISNKKYYIKVEVEDKLGNIGSKEITITTEEFLYTTGEIEFNNIIWRNSIARITINNKTTDYDMEYQVKEDGTTAPDINDKTKWTKITDKTSNIDNLKEGNIIYARLTDGVNSSKGYASSTISNVAVKGYSDTEFAKVERASYEILAISTSSNKMEVQINKKIEGASLYNYYYKNINDDSYKLISSNTYYDDKVTITDIKANQTYKIKVLVINSEGKVTRCENTATLIASTQATTNTTYTGNKTYIDNSQSLQTRKLGEEGYGNNATKENTAAGYPVSVPQGFKISNTTGENKQSEGIILKDAQNNEYMWVPVNDAIHDENTVIPTNAGTASSSTYKPMAIKQSSNTGYYEGIIYTFNGVISFRNTSNTGIGKSSYREPSLITGSTKDGYTWNVSQVQGITNDAHSNYYNQILGFTSSTELGEDIANNYNNMILSVDSFGGFYVSRYETTKSINSTGNIVIGSKSNNEILSNYNWYELYLFQDSRKYTSNPYYGSKSVVSSMLWGSQYDAMLNYILKNDDKSKITAKTGTPKNTLSKSAEDSTDIINNLYDLGSNAYEWTQEASGTTYRIYRGGGYDKAKTALPSSRNEVTSTDRGPIFGSRLQLYIISTSDTTGPVITITGTSSTSNKITVKATAQDKETGVSKYTYYIKESSNPEDTTEWKEVASTSTGNYTYTNIKQNTTYSIKIVATDGAGNAGKATTTTVKTQELGNIAKDNIEVKNKYGKSGEGVIQLAQSSTNYSSQGYYIQYQVLSSEIASDQTLEEANWKTGELVTGLSNNQIIYASLYDGINRSADYLAIKITGLEGFEYYIDTEGNSSETKTVKYTDSEGNTATIPAGFKVGTGETTSKVNEGLVIQDTSGNEFVWVPIETVVETSSNTTGKEMARKQTGNTKYYEGILYNFSGTTSSKQRTATGMNTTATREPSLITVGSTSDDTWNIENGKANGTTYDLAFYSNLNLSGAKGFGTYTEFGQYMNEQYSNMIKSVDKYKGFYVGRYETSTVSNLTSATAIVQSQTNKVPIYNQNWYHDFYYQDSNLNSSNPYYTSKSVTSSMIWGSQWDAMLNWMLKDEKTKDFVTSIVGNRTGARSNTGQYGDDLAKNIFDLSGNVVEWTQEATSNNYRNYRGGSFLKTTDKYGIYGANARIGSWRPPTITTIYTNPTNTGGDSSTYGLGTRMSLYINNTDDTTAPVIDEDATNETIETGTNNIKIKVQAVDSESGIKKYKYTISLKDFSAEDFSESYIVKTEESFGWAYEFSGLTQNSIYYIKVEVTNNAGKTSTYYSSKIQTELLTLTENPTTLEKTYGKSGNGVSYLKLSDTYKSENYHIEYQILKDGETPSNSGWKTSAKVNNNGQTFTDGCIVKGLSTGDIIYTRIADGKNNSLSYKTTTISELETYSEIMEENYEYPDDEGNTAVIPAGFRYGTSSLNKTISKGLVIEDEAGNQYVWVPVENAVYDETTTVAFSNNTSTYKPMARKQSGYAKSTTGIYYEGILYSYSGVKSWVINNDIKNYRLGTTSYREPSLVTGSTANLSWQYTAGTQYDADNYSKLSGLKNSNITSPATFGQYLNRKYTEMVESVKKNKGFYIGRYETSSWVSGATSNKDNTGEVIKSVARATPMATTNWYNMYLKSSSDYESNPYSSSTSVTSSMIWGSQYDAALNYLLTGSDKTKVTLRTGNHSGARSITGEYPNDIMNNIFDLSSNVREWTVEANSSAYRTYRGGVYGTGDSYAAVYRYSIYSPTNTNSDIGSRLTLYIK